MTKLYKRLALTGLLLAIITLISIDNSVAQVKTTFKYFVGTSEPSANWKNKDFDASSWNDGYGSIGYGDNDDSTTIAKTASVYLRCKLSLSESYLVNKIPIVFSIDFDDAFVGYINGVEFIRVNMAETPANPGHLATSIRSHEAESYRRKLGNKLPPEIGVYNPVMGYYIDTLILSKCNLDTTNVLAFEVHNDSINGSDLTFNYSTYTIPNNFVYNFYSNRFIAPVKLDTSRLPIIVIETNEYGVNDADAFAFMGVINNGKGQLNSITDTFTDFKGRVRIKLHGQTSKDYPKKQFKIEIQDSLGADIDTALMGMPQGTDWILYGPFPDKSLLRNQFVFKLGKQMGYYEPRTRFCELMYNGRNMGLYVLTEQIKRDNKRVDIALLDTSDKSGEAVTGGYIFRFDKDLQGTLEILYPNSSRITKAQYNYITSYYKQADNAFLGYNFRDTAIGYRKYVDEKSLADYIIVNELTKNVDAYYYSCYMYKDRGGKIEYGPLWDYDFSMGYTLWEDLPTTGWQYRTRSFLRISRVLSDSAFIKMLIDKWFDYRSRFLDIDSLYNYIDHYVDSLKPYINRNYQVWPILKYKGLRGFANIMNTGTSYEDEIAKWKTWLSSRIEWMDANINSLYSKPTNPIIYSNEEKDNLMCYPNPFEQHLNIGLRLAEGGNIKIVICDLSGKKKFEKNEGNINEGLYESSINLNGMLNPGVFVLTVYRNNIPLGSQKIVKIE